MTDEIVINEAERLYKKFGNLALEVVKEIKIYDKNDTYFWQCVEDYIIKYK